MGGARLSVVHNCPQCLDRALAPEVMFPSPQRPKPSHFRILPAPLKRCSTLYTKCENALTIYFPPVADSNDQDEQPVVFDPGDQPIIAYPVFPEFSETLTVQCLTDAAGILHRSDAFLQELADASTHAAVEPLKLPKSGVGKLNRPGRSGQHT